MNCEFKILEVLKQKILSNWKSRSSQIPNHPGTNQIWLSKSFWRSKRQKKTKIVQFFGGFWWKRDEHTLKILSNSVNPSKIVAAGRRTKSVLVFLSKLGKNHSRRESWADSIQQGGGDLEKGKNSGRKGDVMAALSLKMTTIFSPQNEGFTKDTKNTQIFLVFLALFKIQVFFF